MGYQRHLEIFNELCKWMDWVVLKLNLLNWWVCLMYASKKASPCGFIERRSGKKSLKLNMQMNSRMLRKEFLERILVLHRNVVMSFFRNFFTGTYTYWVVVILLINNSLSEYTEISLSSLLILTCRFLGVYAYKLLILAENVLSLVLLYFFDTIMSLFLYLLYFLFGFISLSYFTSDFKN